MQPETVKKALEEAKKTSKKRNFKQSVDFIVNLRNYDSKKPDHQLDVFHTLPHPRGRKVKVGALVGPELAESAKACDVVVFLDDFEKYKEKRDIKKLADSCDFFVGQATIMPKIATAFGRVFGPRGKMPNPKAGCIVPPNANLQQVVDRLQKVIRLANKKAPIFQCSVGLEDSDPESIAANALSIYTALVNQLPYEKNSIKNVFIKLSMGPPVEVKEGSNE